MTTPIDTAALRRLYTLVAYAGEKCGDRALREFMLSMPALLDAADERDRLRADVARLRDALGPFAAAALPRVLDPHPCTERCWRVGGPTDATSGVCVECGLRARADEERSGWTSTEGALRAALAALAAPEPQP